MIGFGVKTLLLLIVISGAIAWLGNYIGRSIGRRRLRIFGLRPRYTATAFTILSGIIITITTIAILLTVSENARTALFGMDELQSSVETKTKEIQTAQKEKEKLDQEIKNLRMEEKGLGEKLATAREEIATLEKTRKELKKQVQTSKIGKVIFEANDVILNSVIKQLNDRKKIQKTLKNILSLADAKIRKMGIKAEGHLIIMPPAEYESATDFILKNKDQTMISVISTQNVIWGEKVSAAFKVEKNIVIYKKGDLITSGIIETNKSQAGIEDQIKDLLAAAHREAKKTGVVADSSGSVGAMPYSEIYNLAKRLKYYKRDVNLKLEAADDIRVIGPVTVNFKVFYK